MNIEQDTLFGTREAASYLRLSRGTLPVWRHLGRGPDFIKIGGKVAYRKSDLDKYLESRTVRIGA